MQNSLRQNLVGPVNVERFIHQRAETAAISCKSFIVTMFGDIISQHGGWIWLGSLIESLQPLGFSERLIRTSVFRLVKEDWLKVSKIGRKSFYAYTESANKHYTKAARRIYAGQSQHSDGQWLIVVPTFVPEEKIIELKKQLRWLGFSPLASGAFAHPSVDQTSLEETISELELSDSVITFTSRIHDQASAKVLKKLIFEKWGIQQLQNDYQSLLDSYSPILEKIVDGLQISHQQSMLLRCLFIHEYRRILLKDHELPKNMLAESWSGFEANRLAKNLYKELANASCQFIVSELFNQAGQLLKADKSFKLRFN